VDGPGPARRWERPALGGLLLSTAVLYLYGLSANGWCNAFYSAAAQAGSVSWKAFFFGSSDAANSITVDKTPASLWVMSLSVRVFGLNSWSLLVPEALMGVATVAVLYFTVRRISGPVAGLLAGATLALTPVAALMFRFNNPDAMLVLLLTLAAWATLRAVETAGTRWLVYAGVFVGFGFLAKMLQAFVVLPVFALVYLVVAPTPVRRRIWQLLLAGAAVLVSAGWWVAIASLVPASDRPYFGGSQHNSVIELALGYNGLGRLTGDETGSVGGGGGGFRGGFGGGIWGSTGITRMFDGEIGGQVAWLIPAALALLVVGLVVTARRARTDRERAAYLLWGGWLLVTGLLFSFMAGIFHAYYTIALAPAIGALVGMGSVALWRRRRAWWASGVLAAVVLATVAWAYELLDRSADWYPQLRVIVVVAGVVAAVAILAVRLLPGREASIAAVIAVVACLAGPGAYAVQTAGTGHSGSIPTAGPATSGGFGPGRGFGGRGGGPGGGFGGGFGPGTQQGQGLPSMPGGQGTTPQGQGLPSMPGGQSFGGRGFGGGGGMGGLLDAGSTSSELVALLKANASSYTWVAAAIGSNSAAGIQLSTQLPVMPIGGFNGSDPSPTLAQFQQYVQQGKIHYFIGGSGFGGMGQRGGSNASSDISSWVAANYTAKTVGGTTVYDLTAPKSSTTSTTSTSSLSA